MRPLFVREQLAEATRVLRTLRFVDRRLLEGLRDLLVQLRAVGHDDDGGIAEGG